MNSISNNSINLFRCDTRKMLFSLGATRYLGVKCYTATTYFQVVQKKKMNVRIEIWDMLLESL